MAENRKEVSLNEIEQATGGTVVRFCRHQNKSLTRREQDGKRSGLLPAQMR